MSDPLTQSLMFMLEHSFDEGRIEYIEQLRREENYKQLWLTECCVYNIKTCKMQPDWVREN
jgi:hypothetical protein